MIDATRLPDVTEEDLTILPLERSETIPSTWYTNPGFHELEREAIFSQSWQGVTHLSRVHAPGDQIITTIAGNPILVVRGQDNVLRAFYNVCRHRGGPLAMEDGNTKVLQCKYHGWTYLLDGSLRGTPRFNRVELFDRKEYGLVPVSLDTWEGLVFVKLADGGPSLSSLLAGVIERISPERLAEKQFSRRVMYEVDCNWKVYIDNYLEGYHLPYVHPELCNVLDYQNYVTETFEFTSLQHSPISPDDRIYGTPNGQAFYCFLWPNFMMNILPGRLQTNLVLPTSHDRCSVIFDYYYDDVTSANARSRIEEDVLYSDRVQKEDAEICGYVQNGLASRAYSKGRFSVECESGVYHFQSLLKHAYRRALANNR